MNYDFIIIGSGPAGSTLSWRLEKQGFKIALIDRAKYEKKKLINDFFCPFINKTPNYYTPVYSDQLGGNSALWHGKIYLISEKEFNSSSWGFDYSELKHYSDDLAKKLNLDRDKLTKIKKIENKNFHYSLRSKINNVYKFFKVNEKNNIDIYKGFSPTRLIFSNSNNKVSEIVIKNEEGLEKNLIVKHSVVFCAGGLGNPHLLKNLLPDNNKLIGSFLSDHPHVNLCKIKSSEFNTFEEISKPNIKNNLNIRSHEEVAQVFQKEKFFAGVQLDYKSDPMRKLRRYFIRLNNIYLRRILNIFGFFVTKLNGLYFKTGLLFNKYYKYSFEFYFSQYQNIDNNINLDQKNLDKFGLKKININWKIKNQDQDKIKIILEEAVGKNGLLLKQNNKLNFMKIFEKSGLAGLHPSCTTKIALNKFDGVVDKNLNLFDYQNIFICGSSVFPMNGFTNPTWTIMTLSNRLANHLESKFSK